MRFCIVDYAKIPFDVDIKRKIMILHHKKKCFHFWKHFTIIIGKALQYWFYSFDDSSSNFVWVSVRSWSSVFQPSFPSFLNGHQWNTDWTSSIRYSIREIVDRSSFVFTCQTLLVVSSVNGNVLFSYRTESLTDFLVSFFGTACSQNFVREVGVHTRTIPVSIS